MESEAPGVFRKRGNRSQVYILLVGLRPFVVVTLKFVDLGPLHLASSSLASTSSPDGEIKGSHGLFGSLRDLTNLC